MSLHPRAWLSRLRHGRPDPIERMRALRLRIKQAPRLDDAGWVALQTEVAEIAAQVSDWSVLRLHDRIAAWLVAQNRRDDLMIALVDRDEFGGSFRIDEGRALPGYLPLLSQSIPDELLVPHERDVRLIADVRVVAFGEQVVLRGHGYLTGVEGGPLEIHVTGSDGRLPCSVNRIDDPHLDAVSKDRWCSYADSGFRAVLDVAAQSFVTVTVQVGPKHDENFSIDVRPPVQDFVRELALDDHWLVVTGELAPGSGAVGIALRGQRSRSEAQITPVGRQFTGRIPLTREVWERGPLALDPGDYELVLLDDHGSERHLAPGAELTEELGDDLLVLRTRIEAGLVGFTVRSPLSMGERGRYRQRLIVDEIRSAELPLQDAVLALCFNGRSIGDNIAPLLDALRLRLPSYRMLCGVTDGSVPVPDGVEPLVLHSSAWHEALATSRILINNAHFPTYFRPRGGQRYLQTWHGTPLKKIGDDVPAASLGLGYRAIMKREAGAWSALLAQNDFAAEVLPSAFGFEGQIINLGYPRNDVLAGAAAAQRRESVRRLLGIETDRQVVLYAPTWRDGVRSTDKSSAALVSFLDASVLDSGTLVLLRGHSNTAPGRGAVGEAGVLDVTDYPDIADLMLTADVLVTDYSSAMFDFCVTGKPMIFLAPDLTEYASKTRGFYLDYAETVPGPIVGTSEEVAELLARLPRLREQYADRYSDFTARFAPRDDGQATTRVIDKFLGIL